MRSLLLASAATFVLAVTHPGLAQTPTQPGVPLHAPSQQNAAPADVAAPTNPTVPAEMQSQQTPPGTTAGQPTQPTGSTTGEVQPNQTTQPASPPQMQAQTPSSPQPMSERMNGAGHEPMSAAASNIDANDTRSTIAPRLPAPPLGPDATTTQLLQAARAALKRKATGEAQEALERAETRLLDRSTEPSDANVPDNREAVGLIGKARQAIAHRDMAQAMQAIESALQTPAVMQSASN